MSRLLLAACMPNLRQLRQIRRSQGRIQEFSLGGRDGERFAWAYNGGLGAEPPAGSRGRAPGQGVSPEAERLSLFQCPKEGEIWPIVKDFSVVLKLVQQSVSSQ